MINDEQVQPSAAVVETPFLSDTTVQVESVSLSDGGLAIFMISKHWNAVVRFEQTYGFRVLDELDLTEFWPQCSLAKGWLFEVKAGGWKALEQTRPHFFSGRCEWVKEYLVVGRDECVSVLAKERPSVA